MIIEEEPINLLEPQLIQSILFSLQNHIPSNASFLAERLISEKDCEEYRGLLAECYIAENKIYKLKGLLQNCKSEINKYRLAVALYKMNKIKEAEKVLLSGTINNNQHNNQQNN